MCVDTMDIYELIGFIIGDGNIYYNSEHGVYRLEMVGNVDEDYDYFNQIESFLLKETGKKPIKFIRKEKNGRSLRIQFNNKNFLHRLIKMGLPIGRKTFNIKIPNNFLNRRKMFSILRGLFEADGCLYFSKSKVMKYPSYPRLEIRTSSKILVDQIEYFLNGQGFKVYIKKPNSDNTFSIVLSGEEMLSKWIDKIGFVSLKNITKYNLWKSKGFYIPNSPLKERLKMCGDRIMVLPLPAEQLFLGSIPSPRSLKIKS